MNSNRQAGQPADQQEAAQTEARQRAAGGSNQPRWLDTTHSPARGQELVLWTGTGLWTAIFFGGDPASEDSWDLNDAAWEQAGTLDTWRWMALPPRASFKPLSSAPADTGRDGLLLCISAGGVRGSHTFAHRSNDLQDPERSAGGWVLDDFSPHDDLPGEQQWTWAWVTPPAHDLDTHNLDTHNLDTHALDTPGLTADGAA